MGLISKLRAASRVVPFSKNDADSYQEASQELYVGQFGEMPWEFDYAQAVEQMKSARHAAGTWVYRALMLNATKKASIPLRLYARKTSPLGKAMAWNTREVPKKRKAYLLGDASRQPSNAAMSKAFEIGDDMVEVDPSHPVLEVLRRSNPSMNGYDMLVFAGLMEGLTGRAHMYPVFDEKLGRPTSLWPMPTQWCHLIQGQPGDDRLVSGLVYGANSHERKVYDYDQIITFSRPLAGSLIYPVGDVEAMWQTLGRFVSRATQEKAFFDNNARPDFALSLEGAKEDAIKRTTQKINALLRGVDKAGKFMVFGSKAQFMPITTAPKDLAPIEPLLEEICATTGVNRDMLLGNGTFSNVDAAGSLWLQNTIAPGLCQWEQSLNGDHGYLSMFGDELLENAMLVFDDPVPENVNEKHQRNIMSVNAAIMTIDEARNDEGLDPLPSGGDVPRFNGVPLDQLGQAPTQSMPLDFMDIMQRSRDASNMHELSTKRASCGCGCEDKQKKKSQLTGDFESQFALEDWPEETKVYRIKAEAMPGDVEDAVDDSAREEENPTPALAMYREVQRIIAEQYELAAKKGVKTTKADGDPIPDFEDIFRLISPENIMQQLRNSLLSSMVAASSFGVQAGADRIGLDAAFDVFNEQVAIRLEEDVAQLAEDITRTTAENIRSTIAQGLEAGQSTREIADTLTETGQVASTRRAEMIARSESARAYTTGQDVVWQESDMVSGKKWLLAPGACPICQAIAKKVNSGKPTPIGEPFFAKGDGVTVGGRVYSFDYRDVEGGTAHPNCRCDSIPVLKTP